MLPDPESEEFTCPRCSAHLWSVPFQSAGLRFLVAQPQRSLDDVLLELLATFDADLTQSYRVVAKDPDTDSLDRMELQLELLAELEHKLPELAD
jgi:hypothetical protein